jgi:hypothetical protein
MVAELIQKEEIPNLTFNDKTTVNQHSDLQKQIEHATVLGNGHHSKVSIYFKDDSGEKKVETTIWAYGSKFICLKGGIWIPISRVIEIKY